MLVSYEQVAWIQNYERQTGFDCLWIEEMQSGEISFEQFARRNIDWYESHTSDMLNNIGQYPQSEEDLFGDLDGNN